MDFGWSFGLVSQESEKNNGPRRNVRGNGRRVKKIAVAISNSYLVFSPSLAPILNFIQIGQKTQLEIVSIGQFWLVGL